MALLAVVIASAAKQSCSCKRPETNPRLLRRFAPRNDIFDVGNDSQDLICHENKNNSELALVVVSELSDEKRIGFNLVDYPMFIINPPRPVAG